MAIPQDIRFCTTADGVRIATAQTGSGSPLVRTGTWLSHLERDVQDDSANRIEALSRRHTFLRYDSRGCGLSDRRIPPLKFDDFLLDLEAVVASRGLRRFALLGISMGAAIAVAYAVRHPEQVSHLVLMNGFARSYFSARQAPPGAREEAELLLRNAELGWGNAKSVFRHVFVAQMLGNATVQQQEEMARRMQLSMTPEMAVAYLRNNYAIDVKDACRQVTCPTLVFHSRGDEMVDFEQGRRMAGYIPDARFLPLECKGHHILSNEPAEQVFYEEIGRFLGDESRGAGAHLTPRQSEVLRAVAAGRGDKEIARQLGLSPRTVEMHVAGAMKALDCATRAEAVARATQAGLLPH
ncbi:alpha/beta fold hydrolase [Caenimonas sedimenti]|uniref:Alpha/beta fold hydrolase n=1 Tax=Caenimonas sedimenti TaxID=2596921 RepID=A0A562ZRB3_9BURK|nr:alpha/beta fold hydrolase [Caenimonas sedimenti]TWO71132.1 alpha/beta fold hydrolase [Caenimonas sedimenti]